MLFLNSSLGVGCISEVSYTCRMQLNRYNKTKSGKFVPMVINFTRVNVKRHCAKWLFSVMGGTRFLHKVA